MVTQQTVIMLLDGYRVKLLLLLVVAGLTVGDLKSLARLVNYKQAFVNSKAPSMTGTTNNQWNVGIAANLWKNNAAVNAFKFLVFGGTDNMVQYSSFTLYGINGAG